jgi:hypothetical protein
MIKFRALRSGYQRITWYILSQTQFILDTVDALNLSKRYERYSGNGRLRSPYKPRMMLKVLLYGYSTGTFSSRKMAGQKVKSTQILNLPRAWRGGLKAKTEKNVTVDARLSSKHPLDGSKMYSDLSASVSAPNGNLGQNGSWFAPQSILSDSLT